MICMEDKICNTFIRVYPNNKLFYLGTELQCRLFFFLCSLSALLQDIKLPNGVNISSQNRHLAAVQEHLLLKSLHKKSSYSFASICSCCPSWALQLVWLWYSREKSTQLYSNSPKTKIHLWNAANLILRLQKLFQWCWAVD